MPVEGKIMSLSKILRFGVLLLLFVSAMGQALAQSSARKLPMIPF